MLGIKSSDQPKKPEHDWIGPAPWIEIPPPGPYARALIARDERLCLMPRPGGLPLVARRGVGSVIEDVDGNRFLDLAGGFAVGATGHCPPQVTAAIETQAKALVHICSRDFRHPLAVDLMERLASLAPGSEPKRIWLTNSAQEAIQVAIEVATLHTGREGLIAFHGAWHESMFGQFTPNVAYLPYGRIDMIDSGALNARLDAGEIAAIFVEAVQAGSGHVGEDPEFLPRLRSLCDRHGTLLACDESQSGLGRTGRLFAFEHFGVVPDIILTANGVASGMPLGVVITHALAADGSPGITDRVCGGNPVCCAAALATLDLIESAYRGNAERLGYQLRRGLTLIADARRNVTNVRGIGLMCAVDVVNRRSGKLDARTRRQLLLSCFERGLILLPCGEAGILFCPALCINEAQLDVGLKVFESVVAAVA